MIALSDNGAFLLPGRGLECASDQPLRNGGVTVWEGGVRVPCVARWPGRIKAQTTCREPLTSMDVVPMALRLAGLDPPADRMLDGKDPTDTLTGRATSPHKYLYWRWGKIGAAIRMGRYKLIREQDSPGRNWQLFDLANDPRESTDLITERPRLAERLRTEYERWTAEVASTRSAR